MAGRIAYYGNIATQGLVLNLDAAIQGSYPKTGSTWFDISNNGNNGTLTNGPLYTGSDYGAIRFDGVNDFITGSNSSNFAFGTGDFTVSYWVYFNTTGGNMVDLRTRPSGDGPGYSDYLQNGKFKLYWFPSDRYTSTGSLATGSWNNITTTRQSTTLSVYFNGILDGTTFSNTDLTEGGLRLARNVNSTGYLSGRIANVLIYKGKALSSTEITQNFNALRGRYGI